jgi:hypothetical protein
MEEDEGSTERNRNITRLWMQLMHSKDLQVETKISWINQLRTI